MEENKSEKPVYVGIEKPIEVRKEVLETSKSLLKNLQDYEDFKTLRKERIKIQKVFEENIEELKKLISETKKALPQVEINKTENKNTSKNSKKSTTKQKTKKEKPKEVKMLEEELKGIEDELQNLQSKNK